MRYPNERLTTTASCPEQIERGIGVLGTLRRTRGFDAQEVMLAKLGRINRWFASQERDAAVVGVSGGVDSAVVLALLVAASAAEGSVLRRVVALLLPIVGPGATGQAEATERGRRVAGALGAEVWEAPLGSALAETIEALSSASRLTFDPWAEGQCLSVMRTPALYGAAALLQAHGFRSVVVGTTNRDEGAYLGFFGKASDGMVDVQAISDLHKVEVRALARCLAIPADIIAAAPAGDVFDGRSDEQMIGASYDAVETVLRLLEVEREPALAGVEAWSAIAAQHARNRHKYAVSGPAVHLDVMPRGVPGGWLDEPLAGRAERRPGPGVLLGEWQPPPIPLDAVRGLPDHHVVPLPEGLAIRARGILSDEDCGRLGAALHDCGRAEPVGVSGIPGSYGAGSVRATAWSPELAAELWTRLRPVVPSVRFLDERSPTDGFATPHRRAHRSWRVVGLSPVLRFMSYAPGGQHYGHYDAGFDYGDGRRSLLSVVFYLTDNVGSGATRFLSDGQKGMLMAARHLHDWVRQAREDEVLCAVHARRGDALVFDHRLCHDVQRWDGPGARSIIRSDVVYEAVPDGRT